MCTSLLSGVTGTRSVLSMGNFSEHTTLLHNEEESFALEPVDVSAVRGQVSRKFIKIRETITLTLWGQFHQHFGSTFSCEQYEKLLLANGDWQTNLEKSAPI